LKQKQESSRLGAIVCTHVHEQSLPILAAQRAVPVTSKDSGWQFHCSVYDHSKEATGKVWLVSEILGKVPSLMPFIENPPGTRLQRENVSSQWERT
jgi:hypothetical protein